MSIHETRKLFPSQEEAIWQLYEELFSSKNSICKKNILNAMTYLVEKNSMEEQMDEMSYFEEDDVCVVHEREIDKARKEAFEEIKTNVYEALEN